MPVILDEKTFYTLEEIAEETRMSVITLRGYVRTGKLKAVKVGRRYFIPKESYKHLFEPKES